jgi:RHS repeat-associated protein
VGGTGQLENHVSYDSFGNIIGMTQPDVRSRYGFTGRERDEETGLYYYRSRFYDPATGRFLSVDHLGFAGGDANLYRYVNNETTRKKDPTGKIQVQTIVVIGIIGIIIYSLTKGCKSGKPKNPAPHPAPKGTAKPVAVVKKEGPVDKLEKILNNALKNAAKNDGIVGDIAKGIETLRKSDEGSKDESKYTKDWYKEHQIDPND